MHLRIGYEMTYQCPQPTPMVLMLNVHPSRAGDLITPDTIQISPHGVTSIYRDAFDNICTRVVVPAGLVRISADAVVRDHGQPDPYVPAATQHPVQHLPPETLRFLLPSRYCDSDNLLQAAWSLFANAPTGWARVQAICDFVHNHIVFNYTDARPSRTASEALAEKKGVCRDFAHLAIALCRAMNIPARYCTSYLSDVGTQPPYPPGDFAATIEVYLGGAWHLFDPRNNIPKYGRVLIARGCDAADVAIATTFGPNTLTSFRVWTDEAPAPAMYG
jgi:transglutaminase-like putative cysteine protease